MTVRSLLNYNLIFSEKADKDLKKIDRKDVSKIIAKLKQLLGDAQNLDAKKLKGSKYLLYRLRCGDYRIIYQLDHKQAVVYIVSIGLRGYVYKDFHEL